MPESRPPLPPADSLFKKSNKIPKQVTPKEDRQRAAQAKLPDQIKSLHKNGKSMVANPSSAVARSAEFADQVEGPPSLVELARALKNDPQLCYEYVYNNIEWSPCWGVNKGALGCLVDGYGNSFDQSMLLVSLLRLSGYTANFVLGTIALLPDQLNAWFGTTTTDYTGAGNYLTNFTIPWETWTDGEETGIQMSHVWVQCEIGATMYVFDPSYKTYTRTTGLTDLGTIMGYDSATFLSDVESGATIDPDGNYVQNLNRANLNADLASYATNLNDWILENNPAATMDDILGGQKIVPVTLPVLNTSLPYELPGDEPIIWTGDVDYGYKTLFIVLSGVGGLAYGLTSDQLACVRFSIWMSGFTPGLYLDGVLVQEGTFVDNPTIDLEFYVTPNYNFDLNFNWSQSLLRVQYSLIATSWGGPMGRGEANYHQEQLTANMVPGLSPQSESVLGETLSVIWYNYAAQSNRIADLVGRMTNCKFGGIMQGGIVGHTEAPYVDLAGGKGLSSTLDSTDMPPLPNLVLGPISGALEAAVLQQIVGFTPSLSAPIVLDVANSIGTRIYIANASNYSSTVESALLTGGWTSGELSTFVGAAVDLDWTTLLPQNPSTTIEDWSGFGLLYYLPGWTQVSDILGGTLFGGITGGTQTPADSNDNTRDNGHDPGKGQPPEDKSDDPIDLFSGRYLYSNQDITIGSQPFPFGLTFERFYNSRNQYEQSPVGLGWTHNFNITAIANSDGLLGMGEQFARQGLSTIVQLFVASDLMVDTSYPVDKLAICAITSAWLRDRISNNTVVIGLPEGTQVFVLQPDGSYVPSPRNASTLTLSGGAYTLTTPQKEAMEFNSDGQISDWTFPFGVSVSFSYSSGLLSSVSALGRSLTLSYVGGLLYQVQDNSGEGGDGRVVQYGHLGSVRGYDLISFTDANSEPFTFVYDRPGRLTQYFKPANPSNAFVTNIYDSLGRVQTQTTILGATWTYYFAGSRSEEDDPLGNVRVMYFNSQGSLIRDINALGHETDFEFDGLQRLVVQTLPEGNKTDFAYDLNNNALSVTAIAKPGSSLSNIVNTFTYDAAWAKLETATDGNGNTTTYSYHATTGNLMTIERPEVGGETPEIVFTYNDRGQILTITDETGIVTQFAYSETDETVQSVIVDYGTGPHLNLQTQFGYDSVGNVNSFVDPNTNETHYEFDDERRLIQIMSPSPFNYITSFTYDANGNLMTSNRQTGTTPAYQTYTWTYSLSDQQRTLTDPAENTTVWHYDALDRLEIVTDAELRQTVYSYDQLFRILNIVNSGVLIASRTYTNNGFLASLTDARGNTTSYNYDGFDRLDTTTYADFSTEQNETYDANGNVLTFITRASNEVARTFDALNRLETKSPEGEASVTYTYDLASRLLSTATTVVSGDPSTGTFSKAYDSAGRLYQEEYPDGKQVTFLLDASGNITQLTYPDGYYVTRIYDEMNRLTDIKLNGDSSSAVVVSYDELSRRTGLVFSNGASVGYANQLNNDLTEVAQSFVGSSVTYDYDYDRIHEIVSQSVSDVSFFWLPSVSEITYDTADIVNQYPAVGGSTYSYDGNGNLTGDGTWTHTFNTENQLSASTKTGIAVGFVYDPQFRQAQKVVTTISTVKTRYIYSGWQRIADYDGVTDALQNRYVFGDGLDEPLIQVASDGTLTFYHADQQGSVIALSNDSGSLSGTNTYGPFGEADVSNTSFGYTGQRYDPETGLYYYKLRYYNPALGRFMQPDPIRYELVPKNQATS